ncbi:hypothetical protein NCCP2222_27970 [Sporosarcina sp. NCCP-2222]|nr:hypothetical protein [Sporosarcina sp. NCCP-2222]GKV56850.1 hypothetical protein NCCP2222_27970 [Sporosarcina sp. NCCP-2222]
MLPNLDIQALLQQHQLKVNRRKKTSGELRAEVLKRENERLTGQ